MLRVSGRLSPLLGERWLCENSSRRWSSFPWAFSSSSLRWPTATWSRCRSIPSIRPTGRGVDAAVRRDHCGSDLGVAAGGMATWFRQRRWRRAARQHEADARRARAQTDDLRAAAAVSRVEPQRLLAPAGAVFTGPQGETSRARRCRTRPVSLVQICQGGFRPRP